MASPQSEELFDIVLVHDVIEHIEPQFKEAFISRIKMFTKDDGIVFFDSLLGKCHSEGINKFVEVHFLQKLPSYICSPRELIGGFFLSSGKVGLVLKNF